ncbi:purple acid phosphatase family protein [Candidatus Protochlamydia phocaeensis]|uniref:purple acid phosphatase family protein n=1 Tax=Candidatus Protochlamydia phocaeensis TaxID=1414722 RepID=UPI0008389B1F|nr:metallophosphoesterase family protein [Candidatus Protochlamydia phocaeensis]
MPIFTRLFKAFLFFAFGFLSLPCPAALPSDTLYLTWQRDPTTTMTIQWLSQPEDKTSLIAYKPEGSVEWIEQQGACFKFPQARQYLIHRVELTQLEPDTDYLFKFPSTEDIYRFRTMPIHLHRPLRFVVGGDMYHDGMNLVIEMSKQAAKANPSFALVGGDIAYAVGSLNIPFQKIERWIDWVKMWHQYMVTPEGRLIPVLAAIGNHDLSGQYDQTPLQAKIFSSLFPMPGEQIYNALDFGSYLSLLILDSGHANSIGGAQTSWLQAALESRQNSLHRFAIYHVPAYPSVRSFDNRQSSAIRRFWVPLFESENLHAAFEHHDHAYKRTFPLLKNKIHPQGVLYLGDGAWGVEKARQLRSNRKPYYLAKFASTRHVIVVTLYSNQRHFMCLDNQGQMIDEYTQPLLLKDESAEKKEALLMPMQS